MAGALAVLTLPANAAAQVDPWGPKEPSSRPRPNSMPGVTPDALPMPPGGVTRLIEVVDGTPYYELWPRAGRSPEASVASRLLPIQITNGMPVGSFAYSPPLTGQYANGQLAMWDYLVRYWERYPNAKERRGHTPRLGRVHRTIQASQIQHGWTPPPGVVERLEVQAQAVIDLLLETYPFLVRSEGVVFYPHITYSRRTDPSGAEVYGFQLTINFPVIHGGPSADGRYDGTLPGSAKIVVSTNTLPGPQAEPIGQYRGHNILSMREIFVNASGRPSWQSQYRGGQGRPVRNPEIFDPNRPKTDIQTMIIRGDGHQIGGGKYAPDHSLARSVAATYLTDWKGLVDRLNGPSAPRAR